MKFFHRTQAARAKRILEGGFRDAVGTYMTSREHKGVWISDLPLDENEGAYGDALLVVEIALTKVRKFEWVEEGKGYREFLVPAALLNKHARVRRASVDEED